jgi:putative nucleotidyltransferase with HDIG domain
LSRFAHSGLWGRQRPWSRPKGCTNTARLERLRLEPSPTPTGWSVAKPPHRSPVRLRAACAGIIQEQLEALHNKDPYTASHSMTVETYAGILAERIGLADADVGIVRVAAALHDIGKLGIPSSILTKPGPLTRDEFEVMKQHSLIGAAILRPIRYLGCLVPLVLHHHEWYDGSGYPLGLQGEEIPFGARIIQVADSIDAMASPRSYKRGFSIGRTISELEQGSGIQFDPHVAASAVHWLTEEPARIAPCI